MDVRLIVFSSNLYHESDYVSKNIMNILIFLQNNTIIIGQANFIMYMVTRNNSRNKQTRIEVLKWGLKTKEEQVQ